jgi:6-phosphogluconate dehydrogenase
MREIARIWKGGCIIRARLPDTLMNAFERAPDLSNMLLDAGARPWLSEAERGWRSALSAGFTAGIPLPAMAAALSYFDGYRSARLPQYLTQAQRDFFGAHTYQRVDRPDAGFVHTESASVIETSTKGEPH